VAALFKVKAHPSAREDRLEKRGPDSYEVWVRAEPENGAANAAILAFLSSELGLPTKKLRIIKGATSPSKIVSILGS
jgi:uncharacterized protein YggU (UPF0235/DUF167 family)